MSVLEIAIGLNRGTMLVPNSEDEDRQLLVDAFDATGIAHTSADCFEETFFDYLQDDYIFGGHAAHLGWGEYVVLIFNRYRDSMVSC